MKKRISSIIALLLALVLILGLAACRADNNENNEPVEEEQPPAAEGIFTPGTFSGVGIGYGGDLIAYVTFDEDNIVSVEIGDHSETTGFAEMAIVMITANILEAQSTNIDTVSGATLTSNAILEAVNDAIVQAGADPAALVSLLGDVVAALGNTEADVIVVGAGLSGLAAAVTAAEGGASVILVEKMGIVGGSSAYAWGGIGATETSLQAANDLYMQTNEAFVTDWLTPQANSLWDTGFPLEDRIETIVNNSAARIEWLLDMGFEFADVTARSHGPAAGMSGAHTTNFLSDIFEDMGGEIHLNTRGLELVQTDGVITGVIAEGPAGPVIYTANQAVILATGGFSRNEALMQRFIPQAVEYIPYSVTAPGSTGDGIVMAEAVGAVAWDDPWLIGFGLIPADEDNFPWSLFLAGATGNGHVFVNQEGMRFTNEAGGFSVNYNNALMDSPGGSILIFDSSERFEGLIPEDDAIIDGVNVFRADTVAELANALGISAENLQATLDQVAEVYADNIEDPMGRPQTAAVPIAEAPFFAVRYFAFDMGTIGGVITDENYQVLDGAGNPIPGLFAVGEMSNRPYWGQIYIGGTSLLNAISSGSVAGAAAIRG